MNVISGLMTTIVGTEFTVVLTDQIASDVGLMESDRIYSNGGCELYHL